VVFDQVANNGAHFHPMGAPIGDSQNQQGTPAVACNGANALVAWSDFDYFAHASSFAALFDLPTRQGRALIPLGATPPGQRPAITVAGVHGWLVAWPQRPQWSAFYQLYKARLAADGTFLGNSLLANVNDNVVFDATAIDDEYRIVYDKTLVHIDTQGGMTFDVLKSPSNAAIAIAHGGTPLIIYTRKSDYESMPRLFIESTQVISRRRAAR